MKKIFSLCFLFVLVVFVSGIMATDVKYYKYAMIDADNIVIGYQVVKAELNPIPADLRFMAEIINDDLIGKKKWDAVRLMFMDNTYKRILTKFEFNERFTFDELVAITDLAKTNSRIAVLKNKFEISQEINLDLPAVSQGLDLLIQAGVLKLDRKIEILK